jgi:Clp amino terminal domain, pathogenicity island component
MPIGTVMNRELNALEVVLVLAAVGVSLAASMSGYGESLHVIALGGIVAAYVATPLLVFAHELGHAAAVVVLTKQRALIQIGDPPFALRFAIGWIDVAYSGRGAGGHCEVNPSSLLTPHRLLIIVLAGPAVSVLVGLGLAGIAASQSHGAPVLFWILAISAGTSLLFGLSSAIPHRRLPRWWPGSKQDDGHPSDGYLALLAIRGELPRSDAASPPDPSRGMTDRARRVVVAAGSAAQTLHCGHVGTEHLLLGLLRERDGVAARALQDCGLTASDVTAQLEREGAPTQFPHELTPTAKRVLHHAQGTLTLRGDQQIDTQHMLLGIVLERESSAVQLMNTLGVDATRVRAATVRHAALASPH